MRQFEEPKNYRIFSHLVVIGAMVFTLGMAWRLFDEFNGLVSAIVVLMAGIVFYGYINSFDKVVISDDETVVLKSLRRTVTLSLLEIESAKFTMGSKGGSSILIKTSRGKLRASGMIENSNELVAALNRSDSIDRPSIQL